MILARSRAERARRVWRSLGNGPSRALARRETLLPASVVAGCALALIIGAFVAFDPLVLAVADDWPFVVRRFFAVVTLLGDSAIWLWPSGLAIIALVAYGVARSRSLDALLGQWTLRLGFFFVAVAGSGLLVTTAKRLIGRVRPNHIDERLQYHFEPLAWKSWAASFPSGHSTTAFAVAMALILLAGPRIRPYAIAVATLVAISRVVVGAHFVSDIIAGSLFGALFTLALARFLAERRIVFEPVRTGVGLALRGRIGQRASRQPAARKAR